MLLLMFSISNRFISTCLRSPNFIAESLCKLCWNTNAINGSSLITFLTFDDDHGEISLLIMVYICM